MVKRRKVLLGLGASIALAGCSGSGSTSTQEPTDSPTNTPTETSTPTDTPTPTDSPTPTEEPTTTTTTPDRNYTEHAKSIQKYLEDVVIGPDVRHTGSNLQLDYMSSAQSPDGILIEISYVIGAYTTEIAEENMEPIRLNSRVLNISGEAVGKYHIKEEWGEKYEEGEYAVSDVAEKTKGTMESVE